MRIAFDVSALSRPHSRGVQRVVGAVVAALERRGVLEVVRLAPERGASLRRWRQRELARAARSAGCAGVHSFTSAFPLGGSGLRVQTVHELPWRHGVAENAGARHRAWAALGALRASRVVCPSAHVARDLARNPLARAKLRVVPWGVGAPFEPEAPAGTVDEVVLGRYRLGEEPFVLCPGAVRPKKDLAALLHGLAERKRRDVQPLRVVVTGGDTPQLRLDLGLASRLGLARWVTTLDEAAEEDLPALYRLAWATVVLSRSEGFGLTVLESLACGTPALVPHEGAQAEVAGAAAIAVDPRSPADVADGLERARGERGRLRALGLARARELTWDATAEKVERLWQELA
jgi:glycosyltransferase involved in cell wall biosynthesis